MKKKNLVVGHLKKRKFAKLISYFLKNDFSLCYVIIKEKPVNRGDRDGIQVPCELSITGYNLTLKFLKLVILEEENSMKKHKSYFYLQQISLPKVPFVDNA